MVGLCIFTSTTQIIPIILSSLFPYRCHHHYHNHHHRHYYYYYYYYYNKYLICVFLFPLKLQVWDTAGQERFRSVTQSYYHNADGVIITYDITSRKSFESVDQWLEDVHRFTSKQVFSYIVGNKCDLAHQRQVDFREAELIAKKEQCVAMETSAKEADNVETLFMSLATQLKRRVKGVEQIENTDNVAAADGNPTGITLGGHSICARGPMSCCRV